MFSFQRAAVGRLACSRALAYGKQAVGLAFARTSRAALSATSIAARSSAPTPEPEQAAPTSEPAPATPLPEHETPLAAQKAKHKRSPPPPSSSSRAASDKRAPRSPSSSAASSSASSSTSSAKAKARAEAGATTAAQNTAKMTDGPKHGVTPTPTGPSCPLVPSDKDGNMHASRDVHDNPDVARSIFDAMWRRLEKQFGRHNLHFPKETIFLNGAPGSGKGTMAEYLCKDRHLVHIATSDLLQSPQMLEMKKKGKLVDDGEVFFLLARTMLQPKNKFGVVVDGFPRTRVQVECVKLLHEKMIELNREFHNTDLSEHFPRPKFHMVMLYIEEEESIKRQMIRGAKIALHNDMVLKSGEGEVKEARNTDQNDQLARERYRIFRENGYEPLKTLRSFFNYHFIAADGTVEEVRKRVEKEFQYQSSLELQDSTYEVLDTLPRAEDLTKFYRQTLVKDLDDFQARHPKLLKQVIQVVQSEFFPQIRLCTSSGHVHVRTDNEIFFAHKKALKMAICLLSERGFEVSVSRESEREYHSVDPDTHELLYDVKQSYVFEIGFPKATM
ncbi:hypothetical protein PTSG_06509 [Salpingoeca rosetta]|uniref:Adenylate kinase n=1 Tax=Salpingoeca rosetta (strain ATCC 50818 / BSB-021) TaxID=946362 RepID=F2UG06_SALR5|nr:uncharacterized protein PTSG_06509 [Salpingoeca rosetta]EGD75434.1 hypothetical protein PTSG_06509 [Salpingoeca rosetta]|eukprot:XP_004991891.1 hypothetical protein PTSG_06509 [Salpingoeca rosetta]